MTFTIETYLKLKAEYGKAVQSNQEVFQFEGHDLYVPYANCLIQYLKTNFEN